MFSTIFDTLLLLTILIEVSFEARGVPVVVVPMGLLVIRGSNVIGYLGNTLVDGNAKMVVSVFIVVNSVTREEVAPGIGVPIGRGSLDTVDTGEDVDVMFGLGELEVD